MAWHYSDDVGQQFGPLDQAAFDELVQSGKITPETMVFRDGMGNWSRYGDFVSGTTVLSPVAAADLHQCIECGKLFPDSQMVNFDNAWVCGACKPRYVQKLKEGVAPAGLLQYAGFWIRAGAKIIDGIILQVFTVIIRLATGLPAYGAAPATPGHSSAGILSIATLLAYAVGITYVVFFNGHFGATPGKMLLKLKIVRPDGSPITYARALGRYFAEIVSSLILGIGYMMAGWDEEKRALHDRICDTRVIRL